MNETLPAQEGIKGESIYQLNTPLTDASGNPIALDRYKGHPVVISMFYASCPYTCPTLFHHLVQIDKNLDEGLRKQVRYLVISFDPAHDKPAKLWELTQNNHLDPERWTVCVPSETGAREIAAVLGIQYRQLPSGDFNHTSLISLLDNEGKIDTQFDGLRPPFEEITSRLKVLTSP